MPEPMSDLACRALAAFISECRDDFDAPGVLAELRRQRDRHDPWQLAVAMVRRAANPGNVSPQLQAFDHFGPVSCRWHPTARVRPDGRCSACWVDANAAEYEPRQGSAGHPLRAALAGVTGSE